MAMPDEQTFPVLSAERQLRFYQRLESIRHRHLSQALRAAVDAADLRLVDAELAELTPAAALRRVASFGLRGEVFFAVPSLLTADPHLLGYYRLLLGISQKAFYRQPPLTALQRLENDGILPEPLRAQLPAVCRGLAGTTAELVLGLPTLSLQHVHELQLLTFGASLVGGENNRIGQTAVQRVFDLTASLLPVEPPSPGARAIAVSNAAGRRVTIEFGADPDILITEHLPGGPQPSVSIEIKGGSDRSNQHNRLGEAEKSHQKAKGRGCFEFWTICQVALDPVTAARESPTTSRFFDLAAILDVGSNQHREFRQLLRYKVGVADTETG
jgi:hypothetical protein